MENLEDVQEVSAVSCTSANYLIWCSFRMLCRRIQWSISIHRSWFRGNLPQPLKERQPRLNFRRSPSTELTARSRKWVHSLGTLALILTQYFYWGDCGNDGNQPGALNTWRRKTEDDYSSIASMDYCFQSGQEVWHWRRRKQVRGMSIAYSLMILNGAIAKQTWLDEYITVSKYVTSFRAEYLIDGSLYSRYRLNHCNNFWRNLDHISCPEK